MKVSLCCGQVPLELCGVNLGVCPKCGEHTEFVDLLYKVKHEYGEDFITTNLGDAKECFQAFCRDGRENVILFEGLSTSEDADEIEWSIINNYYREPIEEEYEIQ